MSETENVEGLVRNRDRILNERRKLAARVAELEAENAELKSRGTAAPIEKGPVAAGETPREKFIRENASRLHLFERGSPEWQAEHDKIMAEADPLIRAEAEAAAAPEIAKIESLRRQVVKLMRDSEAQTIANRLAIPGSAKVLLPFIEERIEIVTEGDARAVRYRAEDGSDTTLEGLTADVLRNPALARVIQNPKVLAAQAAEEHARRVAETLGEPVRKPVQH